MCSDNNTREFPYMYDDSLPYKFLARIFVFKDNSKLYSDSFSHTICKIIEYLEFNNIDPDYVELFGVYMDKSLPLEIKHCLDKDGNWLKKPELCKSLEEYYKTSLAEQYKGHKAKGDCSFKKRECDDRGVF